MRNRSYNYSEIKDPCNRAYMILSCPIVDLTALAQTVEELGQALLNQPLPGNADICTTLLHKAVFEEHYNAVKLLLQMGANPNIVNGMNQTPLEMGLRWCGNKAFQVKLIRLMQQTDIVM